jgi:hypothetical protein
MMLIKQNKRQNRLKETKGGEDKMGICRAYVNCGRCYEIGIKLTGERGPNTLARLLEIQNAQYAARNEAMRALESQQQLAVDVFISQGDSETEFYKKDVLPKSEKASRALRACATCDYSEPIIAQIFEEEIKFAGKGEK